MNITCIYEDEIQMAKRRNGNLVDDVRIKFVKT